MSYRNIRIVAMVFILMAVTSFFVSSGTVKRDDRGDFRYYNSSFGSPVQYINPPYEDMTNSHLNNTDGADNNSSEKQLSMIKDTHIIANVPYINQRSDFPNGCESVSAVMAMQYLGIEITPDDFIQNYLDMGRAPYYRGGVLYGCDPAVSFPGDPRTSSGWGCYPAVIKKAVDKMELSGVECHTFKNVPLSTLCSEFINNNTPVIFWATIDMQKPSTYKTWIIEDTEKTHTWIHPFHCLLLVGYDSEYYYFNDPWQAEYTKYTVKDVETAYAAIGRHSAVIVPVKNEATALQE